MCIIILLITGIYIVLGYYYKQGFMMNTWVYDVYCTGMSVEEIAEVLQVTGWKIEVIDDSK